MWHFRPLIYALNYEWQGVNGSYLRWSALFKEASRQVKAGEFGDRFTTRMLLLEASMHVTGPLPRMPMFHSTLGGKVSIIRGDDQDNNYKWRTLWVGACNIVGIRGVQDHVY